MIRYYLNGVECNPANKDDIEYVFDFTERRMRALELSVDNLTFVKEDYDAIKTWISQYGYYVGMPLDIHYTNGTIIKYLLNFADESFRKKDRSCNVKLKRFRGIDNFFDNADGLSFGLVGWNASDFKNIDYVVIPDDQITYFISLALAAFSLAQELAKSVQEVAEGIADIVKASVPVGIPPAPDWGAIIVAVIKLLARIAYTIFIVIALIKVGTELINLIFPKIRQFKGISVKTLIEKSCQHLGYSLQSSLLDSLLPLSICPVPLREKDPSLWLELFAPASLAFTKGYPSSRDTVQTLGAAINFVEDVFNAKTKVDNGAVIIEQELFFEQNAVQDIPLAFNIQNEIQNENSINTPEIYKRKVAVFAVDPSDVNTFDDTKKSVYEISSEIITSPGPDYELLKGFDLVDIPFARGTRKGSLTFLEKAAKALAQVFDEFTGGNLVALIDGRKDVMQISSQYFSTTKLLWMSGTRLHSDQNAHIGADVIINNYHFSRKIENNQKDVFENVPLAATESEIFNILSNNFVNLDDGRTCEIKRISWSEKTHLANFDFTVRRPSINEQTTVINAG